MLPTRTLLLALLLTWASTPPARAQGVNLRWTSCYGDGGTPNRVFACNTNFGSDVMVVSFELGADLPQVNANEIYLQVAAVTATLPAWWSFKNAGTCRTTSLNFNTFTSGACEDWAAGQAAGGIASYAIGNPTPNSAVMTLVTAVPPTAIPDLVGGYEYFSCNVVINHQKTVGTGACSGCTTPVCILLGKINVVTVDGTSSVTLTTAAHEPNSNYVTFQGAQVTQIEPGVCGPPVPPYCPAMFGCGNSAATRYMRAGPR